MELLQLRLREFAFGKLLKVDFLQSLPICPSLLFYYGRRFTKALLSNRAAFMIRFHDPQNSPEGVHCGPSWF